MSNIKIERGLGTLCDQETLRVIGLMPKWTPGIVNNEYVRSIYNFPVKFTEPTKSGTLHYKDFNWTIAIPEGYREVSMEEWKQTQKLSAAALGAEMIVVLKNGKYNLLEANYTPYDESTDGDYLTTYRETTESIYQTFRTLIPDATIDSVSGEEIISGLKFQTHSITLTLHNGRKIYSIMYSRLFDKKDFTINFTYVDEEEGNKMISAWRNSRFGDK